MAADEKVAYCQIDAHLDSNPKIRRAGRDGRDVFEFILRRVAIARSEGVVPLKYLASWYLADQLMCSEEEASNGVTRAVTAELICIDPHAGVVRVVGWSPEWGRRPKTNAERQSAYRERKQSESHAAVTDSNDESRDVTKVTDQRRGEEIRERGSLSVSDACEQPTSSAARGARQQPIPAAWQPTTAAADFARDRRLDVKHEAEQFRLWALSGGKTFADPDAAFMKFMRGSRDVGRTSGKKPGATTSKPRPFRTRLEDGTVVEEDENGELRPVPAQSNGGST